MIRYLGFGEPDPCRECGGKGRMSRRSISFDCTSCNGTGIEGNARGLLLLGCVTAIAWIALIIGAGYWIGLF